MSCRPSWLVCCVDPCIKPILKLNEWCGIKYSTWSKKSRERSDNTFGMRLEYTTIQGQPVPYCQAELAFPDDINVWNRVSVHMDAVSENLKRWWRHDEIPPPTVPSNELLWHITVKSVLAWTLRDTPDDNRKLIDFNALTHYHTNPNVYFEVREALLDMNAKELVSITMRDGTEVKATDEGNLWGCAKLHFIATANMYCPTLLHNYVHMHFVDIATVIAFNVIPTTSLIYNVIKPFLVNNVYTNHKMLGDTLSDRDTGEKTFYDFQIINQTDNTYYRRVLIQRAMAFYTHSADKLITSDIPNLRVKFGFPYEFPENDTVPYTIALKETYDKFVEFARFIIESIGPNEASYLELWRDETVKRVSSRFWYHNEAESKENLPIVLGTFLWQVSILHSLDHQAYYFWVRHLNTAAGTRIPFDDRTAIPSRMFDADGVVIYQNYMQAALAYIPGAVNDSLQSLVYDDITIQGRFNQLKEHLNFVLANRLNTNAEQVYPGLFIDLRHVATSLAL